MASIVLSPIVTQIVEKLSDLALHHISLFCTLQTELQNLKVTVSAIHAVLLDAEEQQFHNRQVKDWLEKLSEVMYDVDDLLDDFATEAALKKLAAAAAEDDYVERRKTTCWSTTVCSSSKQLMYGYRMAREIRAIREKLELLSKDKDNFHLEVRVDDDLASLPFRETDSCPPTIVVGRKDDHSKIVELLLDFESGDNISVVPIVGIGGLGKTTLAQLAFDDERMIESFEIKVWVYVSQNFDIKAILAKMLESINRKSQPADLALDVLKVLFQDKIRGKRFLFVLDDVWEENEGSWEALGKYLTVGAPGSKVLVTTRSRLVAEVSSKALPYFLEGLELDEAWNLMVKKAGVVPQSSNVESIAREILGKCCGVPLAVNMVAGLLSSTDPETEWPLFLQKELWTISEGENPIMSALRLSFNHLPAHVKRCFAYCKLFPKGHVFDVQRLVQFWRAQGYIESADRGLELNMGLRYFKTLWWRSFFQEVEMDALGNLQICRMHDLMHELAASVTGTKIFKRPKSAILEHASLGTRHLAVVRHYGDVVGEVHSGCDGTADASKVRTLISDDVSFVREEFERVLNNFIRLRVLILYVRGLDSGSSSKLLDSVSGLKHLRFLRLNFDGMAKLPDPITNLVNLQVLDLSWCRLLKELPRDIKKMVNLMHLYLYPLGVKLTHMPKGIGELTSLQTLPVFVVSKKKKKSRGNDNKMEEEVGGLDELKALNALRGELTIKNLVKAESVGYGVHVLKEKPFLQSLVLDWEYNNSDDDNDGDYASTIDEEILEALCPHPNLKKLMILNYGGAKLANWLSTITNLVELSLEDCRECEYLPPLHQLPSLRELVIDACPNLKGLWIDNGNGVMVEEDWPSFPCLRRLEVVDCPNLTRMPLFPTVETRLELRKTGSQSLLRTMNMKTTTMASSPPLSKLTSLQLVEMDDLETLPEEGLSNLTSLQVLEIVKCSRLASLSAVRNLHSLQKLDILECPQLNDRCRKGKGEDWPNISHVPEIMLDGRAFKWGLE
ncbi:unnamed protein product [Linum tenue]|uniref:Disease resistance protein RGA3 n=1 Tax=Linum tenue TaxID=586396 RepID=A0AAV0L6K6_9ROSI|nr:unnamed protein product [Linum tenue]